MRGVNKKKFFLKKSQSIIYFICKIQFLFLKKELKKFNNYFFFFKNYKLFFFDNFIILSQLLFSLSSRNRLYYSLFFSITILNLIGESSLLSYLTDDFNYYNSIFFPNLFYNTKKVFKNIKLLKSAADYSENIDELYFDDPAAESAAFREQSQFVYEYDASIDDINVSSDEEPVMQYDPDNFDDIYDSLLFDKIEYETVQDYRFDEILDSSEVPLTFECFLQNVFSSYCNTFFSEN